MSGKVAAKGARKITLDEIGWAPHPAVPGLERKVLLTHIRDGAPCSLYLFRSRAFQQGASTAPPHVHPHSDDITYVLRGTARLWRADGVEVTLEAGSVHRVPAGVAHQVREFSQDFLCLNMFVPPIE
jgi:mannose-6-phosphate isomerase-like protein (cupin superfamily)